MKDKKNTAQEDSKEEQEGRENTEINGALSIRRDRVRRRCRNGT
jgi:hypothetical protein